MLNRSGVSKTTYGAPTQILANVQFQNSVGCIVPQTLGVVVVGGGKKIVKAGTPINIDLANTANPASAVAAGKAMNAVVLHDVDVTGGNGNATGLIFGFINLNRVDSDVATKITAAQAIEGASPLLVFQKV